MNVAALRCNACGKAAKVVHEFLEQPFPLHNVGLLETSSGLCSLSWLNFRAVLTSLDRFTDELVARCVSTPTPALKMHSLWLLPSLP